MARRAPPGARAVAQRVVRLVEREGLEGAAALLDRAPRTVERLVRAAVRDEPLGPIIPSRAALERWQDRLDAARVSRRAVSTPEDIRRLQRLQPTLGWRMMLQVYPFRSEVDAAAADYVAAGVPADQIRIVRVPGGYRIAKTKWSPGQRRRR